MKKKWQLNLKTLSLTQVIKFDYTKKNVIYFESKTWKDADKFVNLLLNRKEIEKEVPGEIDRVIEEIIKN
jgi:hypothetical protein